MKKTKAKAKSAKQQENKRTRNTLNRLIAGAPTHEEKWQNALIGGLPPTKIQALVTHTVFLGSHTEKLTDEQSQAKERLKRDFADLLFPALVKNDPAPFNELVEAMAVLRREITFAKDGVIVFGKRPKTPPKKEKGRRFRLALLSLDPDDLLNIQTVKAALAKEYAHYPDGNSFYSDDSAIYAAMEELNLRFLQPGDCARWTAGGKVVRTLKILPDGTAKESGMTLAAIQALPGKNCETIFSNQISPDASGEG
jgi:hypothetical protein